MLPRPPTSPAGSNTRRSRAPCSAGDIPPATIVYYDAWTSIGGSQHLDSPATGRYHTHLCEEIVPWVDTHYRTIPDRDHRAIAGKSTGGCAAMVIPMLRPDLFGALVTHAGDALFEAGSGRVARPLPAPAPAVCRIV